MSKDSDERGPRVRGVPAGEDRPRLLCPECGFINYENPKVLVGSVVTHMRDGRRRVLLCRRAIEPRMGFWTLPAGYLELLETTVEGAKREAWEEAYARIEIDALLAVYNIEAAGLVQLIYRARLLDLGIAPGPESIEVRLMDWSDIPWDDIAFPSVHWALGHYREIGETPVFAPRTNPDGATGAMSEGRATSE